MRFFQALGVKGRADQRKHSPSFRHLDGSVLNEFVYNVNSMRCGWRSTTIETKIASVVRKAKNLGTEYYVITPGTFGTSDEYVRSSLIRCYHRHHFRTSTTSHHNNHRRIGGSSLTLLSRSTSLPWVCGLMNSVVLGAFSGT